MTTQPRRGLLYRRKVAGKTMADAGAVIGVTPSHYSKIEKGESALTIERAADLAAYFDCTIEDLL